MGKGIKSTLYSLGIFIVIAGGVLAYIQTVGLENVWGHAKLKASQLDVLVNKCISDYSSCGNTIDVWLNTETGLSNLPQSDTNSSTTAAPSNGDTSNGSTTGNNSNNNSNQATGSSNSVVQGVSATSENKDNSLAKLNSLKVVDSYSSVPYKRTEWKHWSNVEGSSCWNTREEVLYQQAEKGSVVLLDKNKKETTDKANACSIKSGKWNDPYSDEVITDPTKTDVDHTSALAATARAGGQNWDKATKEAFANDTEHLVVTTQKQNRTKGDKTPSEWMPEDKSSHCDYAKIYINILNKYGLQVSQADKEVLSNALGTCAS